ncbi:REP-associated tyrosine transposase [Neisseria leonii]|uniref:REP-associated tyrosine transposase n=1 Tax=Neisseria leonii TaxID=2995413 RepID=UPI00237AAF4D|nr:transposase [Neisseria sp. 3986]MDD9325182.1 transposase [Neisseria sp. 3986]
MHYRRLYHQGGTYFFTVVTHKRQPILTTDTVRTALRQAVMTVREQYPFENVAWVLLPDHMHIIWRLPDGDGNFSERWRQIKRRTQFQLGSSVKLWQNRFWEHLIRDEKDFEHHFDYLHFNPVKHGYAQTVADWQFSTFHRYVKQGIYPHDWGGGTQMDWEFGE